MSLVNFNPEQETFFKQKFAIQWLATLEAINYRENCDQGHFSSPPPVEDAQYMAELAWEEWKKTIGLSESFFGEKNNL